LGRGELRGIGPTHATTSGGPEAEEIVDTGGMGQLDAQLATYLEGIVVEVWIESLQLVDRKLVTLSDGIEGVSKPNDPRFLKLARILRGRSCYRGRRPWSESGWSIWLDVSQRRKEVVGRSGALKISGDRRGEGQHHWRTEKGCDDATVRKHAVKKLELLD